MSGSSTYRAPVNEVAVIAGVSGVTAIWLGLGQLAEQTSLRGRAIGEVMMLERDVEGGLTPLVAFRTLNDSHVCCRIGSEQWGRGLGVGDRFAVRYDPACPDRARMDTSHLRWSGPMGWVAFGLVACLAAVVAVIVG